MRGHAAKRKKKQYFVPLHKLKNKVFFCKLALFLARSVCWVVRPDCSAQVAYPACPRNPILNFFTTPPWPTQHYVYTLEACGNSRQLFAMIYKKIGIICTWGIMHLNMISLSWQNICCFFRVRRDKKVGILICLACLSTSKSPCYI